MRSKYDVKCNINTNIIRRTDPQLWGDEVVIVGFPRAYSDHINNLPLLKSALISTPFGVNHNGRPYFLIDGNIWSGMSGSPVLTRRRSNKTSFDGGGAIGRFPPHLIGVLSAAADSSLMTSQRSSDVGKVWYTDVIEDIISSITK